MGRSTRHYQKFEALETILGRFTMGDIATNHKAEVEGFHGWNYIAITAAAKQAARSIVKVYDDQKDPEQREIRKALRAEHGWEWTKSFAREHDGNLQPREHKLVKLLHRPNKWQTGSSFRWEQVQQLRLHGSCIVFNRPNINRTRVVERYVVPIALTNPIGPGNYDEMPNGGIEVNPTQFMSGAVFTTAEGFAPIMQLGRIVIPVEFLSICRYPHAFLRSDGASPTSAISKWIDTSNIIAELRLRYYGRGANGQVIVTADNDDKEKIQESQRRLEKVLGPDGPGVVVLGKSEAITQQRTAEDMGFDASDETMKAGILAAHHVSKVMVGDQDSQTYGALAAAMMGSAILSVQPDMDLIADEDTIDLAGQYEGLLSVEYEVPTIKDLTLEEERLSADSKLYVMTVGQYRKIRGWEPLGDGLDDLLIGQQGLMSKEQILEAAKGKGKGGGDQQQPAAPAQPQFGGGGGQSWWSYQSPLLKSAMAMTTMDMPLVSVEFNGTIVDPFDPSDKKPKKLGQNAQRAVAMLKAAGARISVFTDSDPAEVQEYLMANGIPFDAINSPENPQAIWDRIASGSMTVDRLADLSGLMLPESQFSANLRELLQGGKDATPARKYGCVMLNLPSAAAKRVKALAATIDPAHLATGGAETEPHVTVLYGLVNAEPAEVAETVRRMGSASIMLGNLSCFPAGEYGVPLKIEVESTQLVAMNDKLRKTYPHVMTHPVYIPHVTVAYVKPEFADLYTGPCELSGTMVDCVTAKINSPGKDECYVPLRAGDDMQSPLAMTTNGDGMTSDVAELFSNRINGLKSLTNGSQDRYRSIVTKAATIVNPKPKRKSRVRSELQQLRKAMTDLATAVASLQMMKSLEVQTNQTINNQSGQMIKAISEVASRPVEVNIKQDPVNVHLNQAAPVVNMPKIDNPITVQVPEQGAPVINFAPNIQVPDQPAPVVNVTNEVAAQPAPIVNVTNEVPEASVVVNNQVNVPEQQPPDVTVNVNPEIKVPKSGPQAMDVKRDADGKIIGIEPKGN